jgi:DNA-binding beta-propeller fold protein YncE
MRFLGRHVAMNFNALHHACCVISRRHFLVALAPGPVARSGPGFLRIFGSEGSSNGQFKYPSSMAWDHQGNVVVADTDNHRLQVIRLSDGTCLRTIGSEGSGAGQFNRPFGVAFDSAGHIIVADADNHRVQVLRYSDGSHVRTIGSKGSGNGQFKYPCSVAVSTLKNLR